MSDVYKKRGRSVRREAEHLVRVDEAGEAIEKDGVFRARAVGESADLPVLDEGAVKSAAREIEAIVEPPLMLERIFVSEAIIEHQFAGITWKETPRRVHISIARPPLRALLDLTEFRFEPIRRVSEMLMRVGAQRDAPKRIRLAEHVGAAVLPFIGVEKFQSAAPYDGKGQSIDEQRVTGDPPPNWFRPSYRVRPRRAWFHLRAAALEEIDGDVPEAIALLAPAQRRSIRVLCVDGDAVYPATIEIQPILAAKPTNIWYPYGAGAFGAELML